MLMTSIFLPPTQTSSLYCRLFIPSGHFYLVVSKVSQTYYVHNRSLDFLTYTCLFLPILPSLSKWLYFSFAAQTETWAFVLTLHSPALPKSTPWPDLLILLLKYIFKKPSSHSTATSLVWATIFSHLEDYKSLSNTLLILQATTPSILCNS